MIKFTIVSIISLFALHSSFVYSSEAPVALGTRSRLVHAQFESINEHQTLTLRIEGARYPVKIAYLRIPIENEPYYLAAKRLIEAYFQQSPWVHAHLTGQKYFNGTISAMISNENNVSLNALLVSEGLAILSDDAKNQKELISIAKKAAHNGKGLWSSHESIQALTANSVGSDIHHARQSTLEAMAVVPKYVTVDIDNRTYHDGTCYPLFKALGKNATIYVDTERLDKLGYIQVSHCQTN